MSQDSLSGPVVIEFVGKRLQLGIIYDSISCGECRKRRTFPYTRLHQTAVQMGITEEKSVERRESAEISIIMLHNSDCSVFSSFHRHLTCFVHI